MKRVKLIFLLLFTTFSMIATAQANKSYHGDGIDDYLRFVPFASVFALKAIGVESTHSWKQLTLRAAASGAMTAGITFTLKQIIHKKRPDGTNRQAFPSGHTSFAFAGATVLCKEYGSVSPWIAVAGYGVATATAISRVCRHRHDWTDVAVGAGIGILSTEVCYRLGDLLTGEKSKYSVAVAPNGLQLIVKL